MTNNVSKTTNFLVKSAVLSAIAVIFMYFEFPILPAFPFLKIDLSDVPALIGAFALGPAAGLIIEAFKNALIKWWSWRACKLYYRSILCISSSYYLSKKKNI